MGVWGKRMEKKWNALKLIFFFCLDVQSYLGRRKVRDLSNWTMQVLRVLVEVSLLTLSLFFSMENFLFVTYWLENIWFSNPETYHCRGTWFRVSSVFHIRICKLFKVLKKKLLHLCCGPVVLRIIWKPYGEIRN